MLSPRQAIRVVLGDTCCVRNTVRLRAMTSATINAADSLVFVVLVLPLSVRAIELGTYCAKKFWGCCLRLAVVAFLSKSGCTNTVED